jgi:hypothetical protein
VLGKFRNMKGIENQQSNISALLKGEGAKPSGLSGAGLSVGNSIDGAQAEDFLKTLQGIQSPESQKMMLAEAMNSNPKAKEAFLEAMKGELVDTNVGDGLDQIVLEKELANKNLSLELQNLLKEMKQTEQKLSQEIDVMNKTGMPALKSDSSLTGLVKTEESFENKNALDNKQIFVGSKQAKTLNTQLLAKNNIASEVSKVDTNTMTKDADVIQQDPRIPLKLNANVKNAQTGKPLASGNDFVQNMNAANGMSVANNKQSKAQNEFGKKAIKGQSSIKGYGKAQNNIKNSMFNLSGADFNNKSIIENDFGTKLQVETAGQNSRNGGFEFISANLETQTPKGFDVINPNTKVLDMSNINPANKMEIIEKIVNHIEQNKIGNSESLDLLVKHEKIGNFRVNVAKTGSNQVDLQIITQGGKGREFFVQNEAELVKALDNSGVKLSNFRLVASASHSEFTKFSSDSKGQGFDMGQQGSQEQSQSKQSQSGNRDSDRRKQLWEQFKDQAEERKSA